MNASFFGSLALYRGDLYHISLSAWTLSAAAGTLGLFAPFLLPPAVRNRLLAGSWPPVALLPFVAFFLGPGLVPSPVTVGPFFFCAAASLTTCALVVWNTSHRRRSLRRLLEHELVHADAPGRSQLEAYFVAAGPLAEESLRRAKSLGRALQAQAWLPSRARRRRAAALLRDYADFLDRAREAVAAIPPPSEVLRTQTDRSRASSEQMASEFLRAAEHLENDRRLFRWRNWLASLTAETLDRDRDLYYAVNVLARRRGVGRPKWFHEICGLLGRAPLTATDVAPPRNTAARFARPIGVLFAAVLVASVLMSTATAQAPPARPHDSGPLPMIGGLTGASRIEPRFTRVASELAGRRAEVRCWSAADWRKLTSGWARWTNKPPIGAWGGYASAGRIHLAPTICASLARLVYEDVPVQGDAAPGQLAWSVAALAHEAQHVRGWSVEWRAECYGMQSIAAATEALGRTEKEGRYLASLYWRYTYSKRSAPYHSRECRNEGDLDIRPQTDVWP